VTNVVTYDWFEDGAAEPKADGAPGGAAPAAAR
jgi:hypothetical protein